MRKAVGPWLPLVGLVTVVVVVGLLLGRGGPGDGRPLDPTSPGGLGTKGLVDTLRALGARVEVTRDAPTAAHDTALVLADDLPAARRRAVETWVRAGGTLLVADPASPLAPWSRSGSTDVGLFPADVEKRCGLAALRGVGSVSADGASVYDAPENVARCYPRNDGWWLVAGAHGDGAIVAVGGAGAFVNRHLDEADNAAIAAAILVPRDGAAVAVVQPPPGAAGRRSLGSLISSRVKATGWQLALAFVVVTLWRARRLGRPVVEPQPVQIDASELVVAVGELLQRSGNRARAAELLRDDLRRDLAARAGVDPTTVDAMLGDVGPPRDDAELVALAQRIEAIRLEVTRVPTP
jgi:hypothetical protein